MENSVTNYFYNGGLNCAESTLRALMDREVIHMPVENLRMMTGFGGGMQRGATCGAAATREFPRRFESEFGALTCREHALKSEGMYRRCTVFVEKAAEIAGDILRETDI